MKLTYEQLRMLAQLGPSNDRIVLKNRKGHVIKPNVKWDAASALKETRYRSSAVQPRPFHAHTGSLFQISPPASSSQLPRLRGKR